MPEKTSKKNSIEVQLDTEKLTQNINSLNSVIDNLLAKQQQLSAAGQQNSSAFNALAVQLTSFQKTLLDVNTQVTTNITSFNALSAAGKTLDTVISANSAQHQKNALALTNSSAKTKELAQQVNTLGKSVDQQKGSIDNGKNSIDNFSASIAGSSASANKLQGDIDKTGAAFEKSAAKADQSKSSFDAHKLTMDHLKTSFDEVKDVSGIFGPSLQEAAKGFDIMKSGLKVIKDGVTGVGTALKADGFDFLLQILQKMFEYFINTSNGAKVLQGVISAVGVVVNKVTGFFRSFMDGIIAAFAHPVDTLKSLGTLIEQNLINRFKAFGEILDGLIHLDFKKVANGVIQGFTGITNATDKAVSAYGKVVKGAKEAMVQINDAYKKGHDAITKTGSNAIKNPPKRSTNSKSVNKTNNGQNLVGLNDQRESSDPLDAHSAGLLSDDAAQTIIQITDLDVTSTKIAEDQKVSIKRTALQQVEDFSKQSASRMESDAINILTNSIKQQSDAKIAALEKDKAGELSNANLTSAQKLAIQQKYQQQENAIKTKAFKEEQELSIAQAIINGAQAVTKVTAQSGLLAALEIGIVVAETAAQVSKIASQKPPAYAKGGLHYASDGRGGVLAGYSRTDNTNAYLRSGEGVVVSEAMRVPWARNLVSAINVGFGGRDFSITNPGRGYAIGGIFTDGGDANRYYNQPVNDQRNLANTIAYQMVNNFPPVYVDVKDINNQQNILAQTINRVNL